MVEHAWDLTLAALSPHTCMQPQEWLSLCMILFAAFQTFVFDSIFLKILAPNFGLSHCGWYKKKSSRLGSFFGRSWRTWNNDEPPTFLKTLPVIISAETILQLTKPNILKYLLLWIHMGLSFPKQTMLTFIHAVKCVLCKSPLSYLPLPPL